MKKSLRKERTVTELLDEARGKVYTAEVSRLLLAEVKANYIVTSMLKQGEQTTARFIAETAPNLAEMAAVEPNCEDAYMYCLYQNGCEVKSDVVF